MIFELYLKLDFIDDNWISAQSFANTLQSHSFGWFWSIDIEFLKFLTFLSRLDEQEIIEEKVPALNFYCTSLAIIGNDHLKIMY